MYQSDAPVLSRCGDTEGTVSISAAMASANGNDGGTDGGPGMFFSSCRAS